MNLKLLLLIILIGGLLRLFLLGSNPNILNRDEAALAYNTLLLQATGKDEWGRRWPLALESFGDYKLIGYPLFLILLFAFFEPSDFIARLPSSLAGIGLIGIGYWWGRRIFDSERWALLLAFLLAVSPVFIFYSRIAFEANIALFLYCFALYLLLLVPRRTFWTDVGAALTVALACATYNTPLLLLPFVVSIIPFHRGFRTVKNWLFPVTTLSAVFAVFFLILAPLTSQKSAITIFSDPATILESHQYYQQFPPVIQSVLGNKYVFYARIISRNFLNSFSPKFLVFQGGSHPWHSLPNWGHLFLPVYGMGLLGVFSTLFNFSRGKRNKEKLLLIYLLCVSLAPSVVTIDSPHTTRSLLFLFIFTIFAVIGVQQLARLLESSKKNWVDYTIPAFVGATLMSLVLHQRDYWVTYPQAQPQLFQSGFNRIIAETSQSNEKVAIVDPSGYLYILASWYAKIPPETFFETVIKQQPDIIGFKYGQQVGRYRFIADKADRSDEKILIEWNETSSTWKSETF